MKKNKTKPTLINSYQKLINISCDLASELDLNILLSKIVNAASEVSDSEEASILMFDPAKNTLYFQFFLIEIFTDHFSIIDKHGRARLL